MAEQGQVWRLNTRQDMVVILVRNFKRGNWEAVVIDSNDVQLPAGYSLTLSERELESAADLIDFRAVLNVGCEACVH